MSDKDIAAARAMLADESLSVAEVCERLGTSTATLYRHLPKGGRSALFEESARDSRHS